MVLRPKVGAQRVGHHASSHLEGGADAIRVDELQNYPELIGNPVTEGQQKLEKKSGFVLSTEAPPSPDEQTYWIEEVKRNLPYRSVQLRNRRGASWDYLYPKTTAENVTDANGRPISEVLDDISADIDYGSFDLSQVPGVTLDNDTALGHVKTRTMEVKIPGDYANLTAAFNAISRFRATNDVIFDIIFEAGHQPSRGVSLSNGYYGHVRISSEDDILEVSDSFAGQFLRTQNCVAPVLNTLVDMRDRGDYGLRIEGASSGYATPQSGVINAGTTCLYVRSSTFQAAYSTFSGSNVRNVWVTRGANVSLGSSDLSGAKGERVGVYVSRASILDASDCDISDCRSSYATIQVLRSKVTLLGADVSNAERDAVHAGSGSEITLRGGNLSGAGRNAIRCTGGSTIHLGSNIDCSNAGGDAIYVSNASRVSGTAANATNAGGCGVYAFRGSTASVPEIDASGATEAGLLAREGSKIVATGDPNAGPVISNCEATGVYADLQSEIVVSHGTIANNNSNGVYARFGSNITLNQTTVTDNATYGIWSLSSQVVASHSEVTGSGNTDLFVDRNGVITANGTSTTNSWGVSPSLSDINVDALNEQFGSRGMITA